jgi:hypothetical protein
MTDDESARRLTDEHPAIAAWLAHDTFRTYWDQLDDDQREQRRLMAEPWMAVLPPPRAFGKVRITWEA